MAEKRLFLSLLVGGWSDIKKDPGLTKLLLTDAELSSTRIDWLGFQQQAGVGIMGRRGSQH